MNAINMSRKAPSQQVSEFHIGPPINPAYDDDACLDRIEQFMGERFPGIRFRANTKIPFRQLDEFCIIPMMGYSGGNTGDPDEIVMLPQPSEELMARLYAAIASFDPKAPAATVN